MLRNNGTRKWPGGTAYHVVVLIVLAYAVCVCECILRHHPRAALLCIARAQFVLRDDAQLILLTACRRHLNTRTHTHPHTRVRTHTHAHTGR